MVDRGADHPGNGRDGFEYNGAMAVALCEKRVGTRLRELKVRVTPTSDQMAQVIVLDNGKGIDPDIVDRLFQPFITTKRDGMGVGLSISRTIIEAHGGRIWARSRPEGGAEFGFTVRRLAQEELESAQ